MLSPLPAPSSDGVSLIELMIAVAIISVLLVAALPNFQVWLQNLQIRNAAESILNGLQLARSEAVRRNAQVQFQLTSGAGLSDWSVGCVTASAICPAVIQSRGGSEGSGNARLGTSTAPVQDYATALGAGTGMPASVAFGLLGNVTTVGAITRIDVVNPATAGTRRLVIIISSGGQIRMCDPAFALAANPQGCA